MIVFALDPGLTTGVARLNTKDKLLTCSQFTDPISAWHWMDEELDSYIYYDWGFDQKIVFVGELFTGGGYLTKEAKATLKIIGFFETIVPIEWGKDVEQVWVPADMRKSALTEAKSYDWLPGPHGHDALAHAIAYARRVGEWT